MCPTSVEIPSIELLVEVVAADQLTLGSKSPKLELTYNCFEVLGVSNTAYTSPTEFGLASTSDADPAMCPVNVESMGLVTEPHRAAVECHLNTPRSRFFQFDIVLVY